MNKYKQPHHEMSSAFMIPCCKSIERMSAGKMHTFAVISVANRPHADTNHSTQIDSNH